MALVDKTAFIVERLKAGARLANFAAPLGQRWILEKFGTPAHVVTPEEMRQLVIDGLVETDKAHPNYLAKLTPKGVDSAPPTKSSQAPSTVNENSREQAVGPELVAPAGITDQSMAGSSSTASEQSALEIAAPITPAAQPYTFDQLLDRETGPARINLVFHLHVPKAGGKTVVALLNRIQAQSVFIPLEFDMVTSSFFRLVPKDRWLNNYREAGGATPFLMTGHFRMDAPTLRNAPMPHAIVTTLRDPIARVLSHYNYTLRVPGNPWRSEVISGDMSFLEYAETLLAPNGIGPQYSFFDDTGVGTFARSGTASARHCLDSLLNKVGVFGLIERFDEFAALAAYLLRSDGALAAASQNVTRQFADISGIPLKTSLTDEERSNIERMFGDDIWFYEEAKKEYERRVSHPRIQTIIASAAPLLKTCRETIEQINRLPSWQP